jgi:feruloyl esterase
MTTTAWRLTAGALGILFALAACGGGGGGDAIPAPAPTAKVLSASDCAALATQSFTNSPVVASTAWVDANTLKATAAATTFLPAHCVVKGTINPRTGSDGVAYGIQFELRLPSQWNSRFFFQGGSGTDGSLASAYGTINPADGSLNVALTQGYAVVSTDGGHENALLSTTSAFGADNQARIDYGYNAIDKTATTAKSIIGAVYGKAPDRSYFVGCSNGGRQGMQFSQKFPGYFDGIVAGDPVMDLGSITAAEVWGLQQIIAIAPSVAGVPQYSLAFSASDRQLYTDAYLHACDAADGVVDGMVQDASTCHFDVSTLQCPGAKTSACWSPQQVQAVRNIVGGPADQNGFDTYAPGYLRTRETVVQGYPLDFGWMSPAGQPTRLLGTTTSAPGDIALGGTQIPYMHITPPDPTFNPLTIDWLTYPDKMTVAAPWLSTQIDLSAFTARSGKIIFFHGSSDPGPSVANTVRYYEQLAALNGGFAATQKFARLFQIPGMGHCSGGPATDSFDPLAAIVAWVESGATPERIVATARASNTALTAVTPAIPAGRTRPLCPFPAHAAYSGNGNVDDAANCTCTTQ